MKRLVRSHTIRTVPTTSPMASLGIRGDLRYELRIRHPQVMVFPFWYHLG